MKRIRDLLSDSKTARKQDHSSFDQSKGPPLYHSKSLSRSRKTISLLLFLLLAFSIGIRPLFLRAEQSGTIKISLEKAGDHSLENVSFGLVPIADEKGLFGIYEGSEVDLSNLENAKSLQRNARKMENWLKKTALHPNSEISQAYQSIRENTLVQKTDSRGETVFENLPALVYLLYESEPGEYESIEPLIIRIPSPDQEHQDAWNLTIIPKHGNTGTLSFLKINAYTREPIPQECVFASYEKNGEDYELIETVATNEKGELSFYLEEEFYIKELKAPDDYKLNTDIVRITHINDQITIDGKEVDPDAITNLNNYPIDPEHPTDLETGKENNQPLLDPVPPLQDEPAPPAGETDVPKPEPVQSTPISSTTPSGSSSGTQGTQSSPFNLGKLAGSVNTALATNKTLLIGAAGIAMVVVIAVVVLYRKRRNSFESNGEDVDYEDFESDDDYLYDQ